MTRCLSSVAGCLCLSALAAASLPLPAEAGEYRRVSSWSVPACQNVDSLAWSPDARVLVSTVHDADDHASLQLWRDGALFRNLKLSPGLYQALFSPDGAILALVDRSTRMGGTWLLDPATGATRNYFEIDWPVSATAFTPDGSALAASPIGPVTGLWSWDTRSWRRATLPLDSKLGTYQQSLDFLPGGLVAISYADGYVAIRDARTGELRRRLSAREGVSADIMAGPSAVSSDARWMALAYTPLPPTPTYLPYSWRVRIWDLQSGARKAELRPEQDFPLLAFRPGTALLAVPFTYASGVLLFEPGSWKQVQTVPWPGHLDTLAFGPRGDLTIAGPGPGKTCRVEIWSDR